MDNYVPIAACVSVRPLARVVVRITVRRLPVSSNNIKALTLPRVFALPVLHIRRKMRKARRSQENAPKRAGFFSQFEQVMTHVVNLNIDKDNF